MFRKTVASFITFFFILTIFTPSNLMGRWMDESEASVEILKNNIAYDINEDGTFQIKIEREIRVLDERGREGWSLFSLAYDASNTDIEVIEAKSITDGEESVVQIAEIEKKPLASDPSGLSHKYQLLVPFKNIVVGSRIQLTYIETKNRAQIPNYFSSGLTWHTGDLWQASEITYKSKKPLHYKINNPRGVLDYKMSKSKGWHVLRISLVKPVIEMITNERGSRFMRPHEVTNVTVSTENNYQLTGSFLAQNYENVLKEDLPNKLKVVVEGLKSKKTPVEQFNYAMASLIGTITYLGTWDNTDGHLVPRSLQKIMDSGYGDCKEYSVCLVAILRALGYDAKIALVDRGDIHQEEESVATLAAFNHAIVKVVDNQGKVYWLDPTNTVAMADGIHVDIADRPALVLDVKASTLDRIPPIDCTHSRSLVDMNVDFKDNSTVHVKGSFQYFGESAIFPINALYRNPGSTNKDDLVFSICKTPEPKNIHVEFPKIETCIVKDIEAKFEFEENEVLLHTNLGQAITVLNNWAQDYLDISPEQIGTIFIGFPETVKRVITYKNITADQVEALNFDIKSPWLHAKRDFALKPEGLVITQTFQVLKSYITPEEYRSKEFKKFQDSLHQIGDCTAVVVRFKRERKS